MSDRIQATYDVELDGQTVSVHIERVEAGEESVYRLTIGDTPPITVPALQAEPGVLSLMLRGRSYEAGVLALDDGYEVDVLGIPHELSVIDPKRKALRTAGSAGGASLKTQMPGRVVRVLVSEGDVVEKGEPLVVVEAMKMENELKSPQAGTIARVLVKEGDVLEARAVLIELGGAD